MATDDGAVHEKFKLNGNSYTKVGLKELAYDLTKEGSSFEKSIGNFLSEWLDEKPVLKVETSGSTGKPKTIALQKKQMANSALATGEYFNLKEGSTALLCLPADYIAGKMMLVRAMVLGLELDYAEPSSRPLTGLSKNYDFAAMVPLQLEESLAKIEMIKTLIVGGAPISNTILEQVQKINTSIYETYGMTETITHVAVKKVDAVSEGDKSFFKALPNVLFSKDDRGCLIISAPEVSNNRVITNDLVNLRSETKFEWLGRYDNIINSGGVKLIPEQIEAKLKSIFDFPYFVAGISDEKLGQRLVLVVEREIDEDQLIKLMKSLKTLSKFEIPKEVYPVFSFSYTRTGKINRSKTLNRVIK